jgi:hypothetical protein
MQQARTRRGPEPALIVAIIALIAALTGTSFAAVKLQRKNVKLHKNSVGTKQLKAKAVTTGKIANGAVTGAKVAANTLTSADINIGQLGTVPSASSTQTAQNSNTISGHGASCPGGTTLLRGICYDLALNPVVGGVKAAANACAGKGGYLPTPMQLYSIRSVINLGTGTAPDYAVSDQYYADNFAYKTVVVDGSGKMEELPVDNNTKYICAYELVR